MQGLNEAIVTVRRSMTDVQIRGVPDFDKFGTQAKTIRHQQASTNSLIQEMNLELVTGIN